MIGACPIDSGLLGCVYRCYPGVLLLGSLGIFGCLLMCRPRWAKILLTAVVAGAIFRWVR